MPNETTDLKASFKTATERAKKLPDQPNDILLKLYALFKQAEQGDVSGDRPGMLNLRGRAKYDAWAQVKGTSKEAAMKSYIELVSELERKK